MEETKIFKVPPKEVRQAVVDRILMRLEARRSSFTREDVIAFGKEAKLPAVYAEEVEPAVIEDLSVRVFSRLLVNGLIIPVKGTKYYRKIADAEMLAAKKAYMAAQEEVEREIKQKTAQEGQNGETVLN